MKRGILIVGGGHNGLVAAFYLARAGFKTTVLERRPSVGGAAITEEFHPGFRCSILAHVGGRFPADIARDMRLERQGLRTILPDPAVAALAPDGPPLLLHQDPARSAASIARVSRSDAARYVEFTRALTRLGEYLGELIRMTPPCIHRPGPADVWQLLRIGTRFRRLGKADAWRLLRWLPMSAADLVEEWFETEALRATIAAPGIVGTFRGPRSGGTGALLLLQAAVNGHPAGPAALVGGGMGALTGALASAARQAGAEIKTGAEVARILVTNGAVSGVVLASGEELPASTIVSNADPRRTFLDLVGPEQLDPEFLTRIRNYRCQGSAAKVNLALSGLPSFPSVERGGGASAITPGQALAGRIHIAPDIDYLERAFDAARYGDFSRSPYMDVTIPSLSDPSLAPAGRHVMSIYVQYAPYRLKEGDWVSHRDALGDAAVRTLGAYAPGLERLIVARQVITPLDLEQTYGLTGGHIFHGEPALDQLFTMRPLLGWARYRTPIRGLYLCGAGTHPGIGLTGASGANASREVLKDL